MRSLFCFFAFFFLLISSYAQTGSSIDFDGDGIPDSFDLDDDNDGIPDIVECPPNTNSSSLVISGESSGNFTGGYPIASSSIGVNGSGSGQIGGAIKKSINIKTELADGDVFENCHIIFDINGSFDDGLTFAIDDVVYLHFNEYHWNDNFFGTSAPEFVGTGKFNSSGNSGAWYPWTGEGNPTVEITPGSIRLMLDTKGGGREDALPYMDPNGNSSAGELVINPNFTYDCLAGFKLTFGNSNHGGPGGINANVVVEAFINPCATDTDGDGFPNTVDTDSDNDGLLDSNEGESIDTDGDGVPNYIDSDDDNDGFKTNDEINCETNPLDSNSFPDDFDGDFIPDCVDDDDDNDGFNDNNDDFKFDPNEWLDTDSDGIGNNADLDDDNDNYIDEYEVICNSDPLNSNQIPSDNDADYIPDCIDPDDDNDGITDDIEISCGTDPLDSLSIPIDTDGDGIFDCLDPDDDNDGLSDEEEEELGTDSLNNDTDGDTIEDLPDAFPLDPTEWEDTDSDGIGNNADLDDDGDGYLDEYEIICGTSSTNQGNVPLDYDGDLIPDCIDDNDDNDYCLDVDDEQPLNENICIDTDKDLVDNSIDLDDDNDGILDTIETFSDADMDGYGSLIDIDSDGDGCFDVVEAGFKDPDRDGMVGISPVTVDAQGLVQPQVDSSSPDQGNVPDNQDSDQEPVPGNDDSAISQAASAYETPLDENGNGIYDFQEFGSDFSPVVGLPDKINFKVGQPVLFTVDILSSSNVTFQWQRSRDQGKTYVDLANSAKFSGVNSERLTLVSADYPDNDDLFRVILSPLAYACAEEVTSNSTSLFYNELFIPNAFSPNGDGVNDYWEILGLQDYPSHRLEIYNRLGIKLYETTNYKNDWNGTYNGVKVDNGTYFYQLYLTEGVIEKGFIFVKR